MNEVTALYVGLYVAGLFILYGVTFAITTTVLFKIDEHKMKKNRNK
jgi:uncharacterized protein YabE (DUF348 family)